MKLTSPVRLVLALSLVAGALTDSSACRSHPAADTGPSSGGRLVATFRGEPNSFNRLASASSQALLFSMLTQASLVRVNRVTGEIEPQLAQEWTSSPDGLSWTLKLRQGLVFSDGAPFTSADAVFTFAALYDPRVASPVASAIEINDKPLAVRAIDDYTIVIVFPAAFGPGLAILDSVPILPRHKLHASLEAGTFVAAWNVTTPPSEIVGLGPFMLTGYTPGQGLRFARNPHYWRRDDAGRPLPYLDEIDIEIAADQNAELLRLESGETDLMNDFARPEDLRTLREAEARGRLRLVDAGVAPDPSALWFNLAPGSAAAKDRPWLQREELRKGISYAVDRKALVDTVYLGAAEPIFGPVTPGHGEWFLPDLPKTDHDLGKAKAQFAAAGLTDKNGDGMLEDARGRPAKFSILTQKGNTARERTVAVLQEQLRRAGLAVDVVALEPNALIARYSSGDYDGMYFGALTDSLDPARNPDFWMSDGSFHCWNPEQRKPATEWEARIDDLMRRQSASFDRAERRRLFADAQRILAEHLPLLHFAAARATVAMSARVRGATPSVLQPPVLWNAATLSIDPAGASRR